MHEESVETESLMHRSISKIFSSEFNANISQMSNPQKQRLVLALSSTVLFIIGFIINITSDTSLYNVDLNVVPGMQDNASLGSTAFINFMNVISNIFNPVICAAYVAIFWLISSRKLEIMVFLVWFIFISWVLIILKMAIHQSRPYWNQTAGVKMLEWTCYSQFGCPSGHAMLGLVLMEFVIRFFMREYERARKVSWLLYILLVVFQLLVMFSRVILGMHTFNQVLMGAMMGMYSIALYYLYAEAAIVKYFQCLLDQAQKMKQTIIVTVAMMISFLIELLVTYVPTYNYEATFQFITTTYSGCANVKYYKSFQYKCLEDSALLMADFGLIIGLMFMRNPGNLTKPLAYTRLSFKYVGRLLIMIVLAAIPAAIFLNPLWAKITSQPDAIASIIWITQCFGFFFAILMLLLAAPPVLSKAGMQQYGNCEYLQKCKGNDRKNQEMELSSNRSKSLRE